MALSRSWQAEVQVSEPLKAQITTDRITGIGLMFVKALLQNGAAKVYIAGRRKEKLDEVASSLGDKVVGV